MKKIDIEIPNNELDSFMTFYYKERESWLLRCCELVKSYVLTNAYLEYGSSLKWTFICNDLPVGIFHVVPTSTGMEVRCVP